MLNRVEIWGLGWPVHDLNLIIFEPRSGFFALVFGVIVLLKEDILALFLKILDKSQEFILQNAAIKVGVHPSINLGSKTNFILRHAAPHHYGSSSMFECWLNKLLIELFLWSLPGPFLAI